MNDTEQIAQLVDRARSGLDTWTEDGQTAAEGTVPGVLELAPAVLDYAVVVAEATDPDLVTPSRRLSLLSSLNQTAELAERYGQTGELPLVQQLESALDAVLLHLSVFPGATPSREAIARAATTYRRSVGQQIAALRTEISRLEEAIDAVRTEPEAIREALDALRAQITAAAALVEQQESRVGDAIARFETQFSNSQEQRRAKAEESAETLKAEFDRITGEADSKADAEIARLSDHVDTIVEDIKSRGDGIEEKLQTQLKQAEDMVGILAATGTSSAFGEEANSQATEANRWRWIAIGIGAIAIGLAVWAIVTGGAHNTEQTIAKAVGGIAVLGIAGYAAGQSSIHRHREDRARRLELDMIAFRPFIEDLPDERQYELREGLAGKVFGHADPVQIEGSDQLVLNQDSLSLLTRLLEAVQKVVKR